MSIVGKYLWKNIFEKPFRTFLLVVCILCCSFVAMLCLDITGNMEGLVKNMLMQATGTADMVVSDTVGVRETFELPCENRQLAVFSAEGAVIDRSGFYSYFHRTGYRIETMDYEAAYDMRLLGARLAPGEGEAAVTERLAREAGWAVGETVTLYDLERRPFEYKITTIVPNRGMANNAGILFLGGEEFRKLFGDVRANIVYIDVQNDSRISDVAAAVEEADYNASVSVFADKDEMREMIRSLGMMFFMIFAVCFLLVIFVAVSVSNRIVSERFSVVGTLRSLGISAARCTGLLLAENALYGLLGSLAGVALYILFRGGIYNSLIQIDSGELEIGMEVPPLAPITLAAVVLFGVALMCACPLKEILRTSKTAIRDIIFNNKDTAYRMRKGTVVLGILCAAGAAVTFFFKENAAAQLGSFVLIVVATALLFPWLLVLIAGGLGRLFEKLGMPIAHLAAKECRARKSTVGSAGLCVTASTLAIIMFIFVSTLGNMYDIKPYDCDVIVWANTGQEAARFSYIKELEGVTDTELLLCREVQMKIDGQKRELTVFALKEGGFCMFSAVKDCPLSLDVDSFAIDRSFAKRLGLKEGDMAEITFDADSYMPVTKTLRLAAFVDAYEYDTTGNVLLLSEELYKDMYKGYPGQILVRCERPEETAAQIAKYSAVTASDVKTAWEYRLYWQEKEDGMRGMLTAVILLGVGLTFTGMISSQLIGFQGRKRECAVLMSTSMSRGKLAKLFLTESMIAAGIALIVALPAAFAAFVPFHTLLEGMSSTVNIAYDMGMYLWFLAALWIVFTLVALFPIRELRKMNLAAQLKYE